VVIESSIEIRQGRRARFWLIRQPPYQRIRPRHPRVEPPRWPPTPHHGDPRVRRTGPSRRTERQRRPAGRFRRTEERVLL